MLSPSPDLVLKATFSSDGRFHVQPAEHCARFTLMADNCGSRWEPVMTPSMVMSEAAVDLQ